MVGSTIQQNYGETITKHGFGIYNLESEWLCTPILCAYFIFVPNSWVRLVISSKLILMKLI
jgi:hypothetical protein